MAFEGFDGVGGTTRIIAARRRQQGRECDLIRPHEQNQQPPQCSADHDAVTRVTEPCSRNRSCSSTSYGASYARGFARMTRSTGGSRRRSRVRTISLSRRFSRFRDTADCLCFGTTSPTRGCIKGEATTRTSKCSVRNRFPFVLTRRSSVRLVSRWLRGNVSDSGACVLGG